MGTLAGKGLIKKSKSNSTSKSNWSSKATTVISMYPSIQQLSFERTLFS